MQNSVCVWARARVLLNDLLGQPTPANTCTEREMRLHGDRGGEKFTSGGGGLSSPALGSENGCSLGGWVVI